MKIRSGFVSNSSSSSFVLITTQEAHEYALSKLNDLQQKIITENYMDETKEFLGKQCVVLTSWDTAGDASSVEDVEADIRITENIPTLVEKVQEIKKRIPDIDYEDIYEELIYDWGDGVRELFDYYETLLEEHKDGSISGSTGF